MYNTNLVLDEIVYKLMDLQIFLQDQYPGYNIEGLSVLPLLNRKIELIIHSEINIPESLLEEISEKISSFVPPPPAPEPAVLSNEELTNLVSVMFAKLAEKNMIDDVSTLKYSKVLQNGAILLQSAIQEK